VTHVRIHFQTVIVLAFALACGLATSAQTADQAWLPQRHGYLRVEVPYSVRALGSSPLEQSSVKELQRGIDDLTAASSYVSKVNIDGETVLGTAKEAHDAYPEVAIPSDLGAEEYWLCSAKIKDRSLLIRRRLRRTEAFSMALLALRRLMETGHDITHLNLRSQPAMPIRWVEEWDNPDGSIERGYGGRSIFFEGGNVRNDLAPVAEYAA